MSTNPAYQGPLAQMRSYTPSAGPSAPPPPGPPSVAPSDSGFLQRTDQLGRTYWVRAGDAQVYWSEPNTTATGGGGAPSRQGSGELTAPMVDAFARRVHAGADDTGLDPTEVDEPPTPSTLTTWEDVCVPFPRHSSSGVGGVQPGMKLEVDDVFDSSDRVRVGTVVLVDHSKDPVLLSGYFDGTPYNMADIRAQSNSNGCWTYPVNSERLHPAGWCAATAASRITQTRRLIAPRVVSGHLFDWGDYLSSSSARPVPGDALTHPINALHQEESAHAEYHAARPRVVPVAASGIKVGMFLEAVDRKYPSMVAPAHVTAVDENHRTMSITFDGWGSNFDYTAPIGDPDFHFVGYCEAKGRKLELPRASGTSTTVV